MMTSKTNIQFIYLKKKTYHFDNYETRVWMYVLINYINYFVRTCLKFKIKKKRKKEN
jgi:hypothetical protein